MEHEVSKFRNFWELLFINQAKNSFQQSVSYIDLILTKQTLFAFGYTDLEFLSLAHAVSMKRMAVFTSHGCIVDWLRVWLDRDKKQIVPR